MFHPYPRSGIWNVFGHFFLVGKAHKNCSQCQNLDGLVFALFFELATSDKMKVLQALNWRHHQINLLSVQILWWSRRWLVWQQLPRLHVQPNISIESIMANLTETSVRFVCQKKTDEDKHGILQKLHINSNKHNIPDQLTKTHPKRTIFGGWKNLSLPSAWIKMFWSFLHGFLQRHEGLLFVKISPGVTYTTWKVDGATPMYTPEN